MRLSTNLIIILLSICFFSCQQEEILPTHTQIELDYIQQAYKTGISYDNRPTVDQLMSDLELRNPVAYKAATGKRVFIYNGIEMAIINFHVYGVIEIDIFQVNEDNGQLLQVIIEANI